MSEQEKNEELGILMWMPTGSNPHPMAMKRYLLEAAKDIIAAKIPIIRADPFGTSNLGYGFNAGLAYALNLREAGNPITHFAMLHADLEPSPWWLDTLWSEMNRVGADMISAVAAIKNQHGITSTALGYTDRHNPWARLTLNEIFQLPETFSIDDISPTHEFDLLLNTGCMLIDLRNDIWSKIGDGGFLVPHFEIRSHVSYKPGIGYRSETETEDWLLSRTLNEHGAKLFATRKVVTCHYGEAAFATDRPWGDWPTDQQGQRQEFYQHPELLPISKTGYWLEDLPDGAQYDELLGNFLASHCKQQGHKTIADLGCGRGWYTQILVDRGLDAFGYDGNPNVTDMGDRFFRVDLTESGDRQDGVENLVDRHDLVLCLEVGEHIPEEFAGTFIDNICRAAEYEVILSWALPNQPGHGHVNCQTNEWVELQMARHGFIRNSVVESLFRQNVSLPYFRTTLMAYSRCGDQDTLDSRIAELSEQLSADAENVSVLKDARQSTEMLTFQDIVEASVDLARSLPGDIGGVLGISRKGMLPATIISSLLHIPLGEVDSFPHGGFFEPGRRTPLRECGGPVLVVDDGIGSGSSMREAMAYLHEMCPDTLFVSAAAFVSDPKNPKVNHWSSIMGQYQVQESEFLNTISARDMAVDMDGVLCLNPPRPEVSDDDSEWWEEHFESVRPLYLPRLVPLRAIVTLRLEQYREVTERWLDKYGVRYRELIMCPAETVEERNSDIAYLSTFKGAWFKESDAQMFVESCPNQAMEIARLSGKPVFCTATNKLIGR